MTKNLKTSFVLFVVLSSILIAWKTLMRFFGGAGVNFVALLVILAVVTILTFVDNVVKNRTKDMLFASIILTALEFLVYLIVEFDIGGVKVLDIFMGIQNVFSLIGILFFAYIIFRMIGEFKNVRYNFVEIMLGNAKRKTKPKKAKELSNGSLEEKPNKTQENLNGENKSADNSYQTYNNSRTNSQQSKTDVVEKDEN